MSIFCQVCHTRSGASLAKLALTTICAFTYVACTDVAAAAPSSCEIDVQPRKGNPNGYRDRGDRCEGLYETEVGLTIHVLSVARGAAALKLPPSGDFEVAWTTPLQSGLHLKAVSLRPGFPYRMDALLGRERTNFRWNLAVLRAALGREAVSLSEGDLGITATEELPRQSRSHPYVPVILNESAQASAEITVVIATQARIDSVATTLMDTGQDGVVHKVWRDKPERTAPLQAYAPLDVHVPAKQSAPGIYRLEIRVAREGGVTNHVIGIVHD